MLTGSRARKLKKSGVDLLGGRALERHMHPFMACELGDDFSLGQDVTMIIAAMAVWPALPEPPEACYANIEQQQALCTKYAPYATVCQAESGALSENRRQVKMASKPPLVEKR